jgi:hypothetical protein
MLVLQLDLKAFLASYTMQTLLNRLPAIAIIWENGTGRTKPCTMKGKEAATDQAKGGANFPPPLTQFIPTAPSPVRIIQ